MNTLVSSLARNVATVKPVASVSSHALRQILGPKDEHATRDILVTPDLAHDWVSRLNYVHQRPRSDSHVHDLAFAMTQGKFRAYSDVHFAMLNGHLHVVNGQHTLDAITKTRSQHLCVHVYRVPDAGALHALYCTFDIARRRSLRDAIIAVRDEVGLNKKQLEALGSAVKRIHVAFADAWHGTANRPKEFHDNDDYMDVIARAMDWSADARAYFACIDPAPADNRSGFVVADVVAVGLITMRAQPQRAAEFWGPAALDDGLRIGDPRKKLLDWLRKSPTSTARRTDHHRAAIACWNAYFAGRTLAKVHLDAQSSKSISGCDFDCKA